MIITYGLLDSVLRNLGLTRWQQEGNVIYSGEQKMPLIVYPLRPETEAVHPWHLSMARHFVVELGLAAPEEFQSALERAAA